MIKILLVDDEAGFATTLGERLQLRGFDVHLAQTGEQAISKCEKEKPNLVLMDLSLPDMSGLDVMEKIKKNDSRVEVIILSGHGMEHCASALEKGAFSFIMKPVKLVELVNVITSACEQRPE